jgi:hypothetical protein
MVGSAQGGWRGKFKPLLLHKLRKKYRAKQRLGVRKSEVSYNINAQTKK